MATQTEKTTELFPETAGETRSKDPVAADSKRTLGFVIAAVACLAITGVIEWSSRPAPIEEYGRVGEQFYPDFVDSTLATSLEVYVFDTDKVKPLDFRVQRLPNGRWVIPSHHNYPADAEDQLSKTAASIIGIERGAMVTRWEADHAQFGVVNPRQDTLSVGDVEGVGKRIILRGEDDAVLADYIIGDQDEGESGQFYVRHPDEEDVYLAKLDINLSTKFTDWIETDLFDVNGFDMTQVTVKDYSFEEAGQQLRVSKPVVSTFQRETSNDPWSVEGLAESEEVDADAMRETVNAIGDLKIVGVRPKQKGLTPELRLDSAALRSQNDLLRLRQDLLDRGFWLMPGEDGDQENLQLIAREGELYAGTDDGLIYRLHFGGAFTGTEAELEIGFSSSDEEKKAETTSEEASESADESAAEEDGDGESESASETDTESESETDSDAGETDSGKPGRYVFVRVDFDRTLLGEEPVRPVEPEKPAELVQSEEAASAEADKESGGEESGGEESGGDEESAADEDPDSESADDSEQEDPLDKLRGEYEGAKKKYDDDLTEYERKVKEIDDKVKEGQEKAEELNRRFAEWYYVIPGDSYEKLRLSRTDLIKEKEKEDDEEGSDSDEIGSTGDSADSAAVANQAAADEFLTENKSKEGVTTTESGLQYEVIEEGEGESPTDSSMVKVRYKGSLIDGTVFDESGDEPTQFGVGQVIKGWTEALKLMKPGAKWKLFIPPSLGYGEQGTGADIGPNSLLIFEVELVSFE